MKTSHPINLRAIAVNAMRKYGFEPQFPDTVIREVNALTEKALPASQKETKDLRMLLWSSIDNYDSMDLDQMEYCERGQNEEIQVKVAIADVDAYVPRQSNADRHAAHNGTSVYTGVETFPMLPDRLSKGMTSLLPGQDHLATVIEYTVFSDGNFRPGEIYRAVVSNKAKLIYEETGDWLEGKSPLPGVISQVPGLKDQILLQAEAIRRLKKNRREQGALELNTIEAEAVVDDDGLVRDLVIQRQNMARCLIEEVMVAANGTMVNLPWQSRYPHDTAGCPYTKILG